MTTAAGIDVILGMTGVIVDYPGTTAPSGFLFCYGQAISRTTYAKLFAVIGTTFGVGDGSTTFNVPDLRGRTIAGKDDMGGTAAGNLTVTLTGTKASTSNGVITGLSSTANLTKGMQAFGTGIGAAAIISSIDSGTQVTLSVNSTSTGSTSIRFAIVDGATLGAVGGGQNHTLAASQIPTITGTSTSTLSTGNLVQSNGSTTSYSTGTGGATIWQAFTNGSVQSLVSPTASGSTSSTNTGGTAHPNVQPTIIMNKIIKT